MATSRTGTTKYLRNRARVIRQAQADGVDRCPGYQRDDGEHRSCGTLLDYDEPRQPNSAEADHILEVRYGGTDDVDNLRVLCRTCNLDRNRTKPTVEPAPAEQFPMLFAW